MKKYIIITLISLLFCSAMEAQCTRCCYFVTIHWAAHYPGVFEFQFHPDSDMLDVTPLSGTFGGVTYVSVHTDLTCGVPPVCSYHFPQPVTAQATIPQAWWDCALTAQPLFIKICWRENPPKATVKE